MSEREQRCSICGNDPSECNGEVHAAEMRASANDYYEQQALGVDYYRDDFDDDYDRDFICPRCGVCDDRWDVEIKDADGHWIPVCRACTRPEDWTTDDEVAASHADQAEKHQFSAGC